MGDNCPECQANNDPRKVPVHPHCNCEVITQNVVTGIDVETWQPIEKWVRENGQLRFIQGNLGQPAGETMAVQATGDPLLDLTLEALAFEPSSMLVLDIADARWSDVERWLGQMEPLLTSGEYIATILADTGDTADTIEATATSLEAVSELLNKRMFLSLIKYTVGSLGTDFGDVIQEKL